MVPVRNAKQSSPYPTSFAAWCTLVCKGSVVRRGLKFAVVVGAILIAINHGDIILRRELRLSNYIKMGLTVVVPYMVSVFSSVGAIIDQGGYQMEAPDEEVVQAS